MEKKGIKEKNNLELHQFSMWVVDIQPVKPLPAIFHKAPKQRAGRSSRNKIQIPGTLTLEGVPGGTDPARANILPRKVFRIFISV